MIQVRMVDAGMSKSSVLATADRTSGYGESSSDGTCVKNKYMSRQTRPHQDPERPYRRGSGHRTQQLRHRGPLTLKTSESGTGHFRGMVSN